MFVLLIAVFLWQPLTRGGLYGPFDILHSWAAVKAPGTPPVKNRLQSDVAIQIMPFAAFNRTELAAGRIPLWNPYSGWGAPHLANGQSGVFSPFILPVYLFDWRWGLILSTAMRLFAAGFFTYLILRRFGAAFWPSVSAGTLYMFGGPLMVWLLWQNSAIAAMLPVALHAAERVIFGARRRGAAIGWLAAALALGMYSGHPEQYFFIGATLVTYVALRLGLFPELRAGWRRHALGISTGCVLGIMLSAPQIMPFAEYLRNSRELGQDGPRHAELAGLHWGSMILQIQPDLFGSPGEPYIVTNHVEINSGYAGPGAWLLAGLAICAWWRTRSRILLFFLALAGCWLFYIYDGFGWYARFLYKLPLFGLAVPKRATMTGVFLLAASAGLALDWASKHRSGQHVLRGAVVAGFWTLTFAFLFHNWSELLRPDSTAHLTLPAKLAATGAGSLILAAWVVFPSPRWAFLLPVAMFLQTGYQFRENTPVVEHRSPEGHSPAFDEIQRRIGSGMSMWEGPTGMYSAINMWYGLRLPSNYDALGVRDYEKTGFPIWGINSPRYLQLFGIRHYVSDMAEPALLRADALTAEHTGKIRLPGMRISREFRAIVPGLNAVHVAFDDVPGAGKDCLVTIEVTDAESGKLATRQERACAELARRYSRWFRFGELPDSARRLYRVTVDGSRVPASSPLSVRMAPSGPVIETAAGLFAHLEPVWGGGGLHLLQTEDALPRFSLFDSAEVIGDSSKALLRLLAPDFDPRRHLVVESGPEPSPAAAREVSEPELLEDAVTRIRLRSNRKEPGWLLALQPYFPGWSAYVNGKWKPLVRANGCFTAVPVPAGKSEIVLAYAPRSFRGGVVLALLGMACCAWLWFGGRRNSSA